VSLSTLIMKLSKKMSARRRPQQKLYVSADEAKVFEVNGKRYLVKRILHVGDNSIVFEDITGKIIEVPKAGGVWRNAPGQQQGVFI